MFLTSKEVFKDQESPYGIPFISFPSSEGDSTFFVTPEHGLEKNRVVATVNYVLRTYQFVIFIAILFEEKRHEGWARYEANEEGNINITIENDESKIDKSFNKCTYFEF